MPTVQLKTISARAARRRRLARRRDERADRVRDVAARSADDPARPPQRRRRAGHQRGRDEHRPDEPDCRAWRSRRPSRWARPSRACGSRWRSPLAYQVRSERNTIVLDLGRARARAAARRRRPARPARSSRRPSIRSRRSALAGSPRRSVVDSGARRSDRRPDGADRRSHRRRSPRSHRPLRRPCRPRPQAQLSLARGRELHGQSRSASTSRAPTCERCCACSRRSAG